MEKGNSKLEHRQPMEQTRGLILHMLLRCGLLSITTPVSLLPNEFDVLSIVHGQMSLATVSQICVIHEAMNGCKKTKDSFKACFENVNICFYL